MTREFTINEFLTYSTKLDLILKNVIESDIHTSSSNRGYTHGFKGFVDVVSKIKNKLTKKALVTKDDSWAVDVDYSGPPTIDQIQDKIIDVITRINTQVLNLMKVFDMQQVSLYCTEVSSLCDLCSIYQSSSRHHTNVLVKESHYTQSPKVDTEEIIQRLSKLALNFNNGNGTAMPSDNESIDPKQIAQEKLSKEPDTLQSWIKFDCEMFYTFIGQDVSDVNVGKLLNYIQDSISNSMEMKRVDDSIKELQKVQSSKGRWFKVKVDDVEDIGDGENIKRDDIYKLNKDCYHILSVFK